MKSFKIRMLALVLAIMFLVTGCSFEMPAYMQLMLSQFVPTHYEDMTYTRPDVPGLLEAAEGCILDAQAEDFNALVTNVMDCMVAYQEVITNFNLAQIRYSCDVTDIYWTDEYNYYMDNSSAVSAVMDRMLHALAASPHREALESDEYFGEGYFDDYEGPSLWDDAFTELMDREAELLAEYYDLSAQATENGMAQYQEPLAQVLVDMVIVRQEIAAYAGFDSFHDFAYDYYYLRDYTPEQERAYLAQVREVLVPAYQELLIYGDPGITVTGSTEEETFEYVRTMAEAMGGTVWDAFQNMEEYGLYDISVSDKKYDASFEVYLPLYSEAFVFVNPTGMTYDQLTFAHEFGHFANDYASFGAGTSIDVEEIFSQGMAYLSVFYAPQGDDLEKLQMMNSLSVYVEQSFYADFEMRLYNTPSDELTPQRLFAIFDEVSRDYGFDILGIDGSYLVQIPHFYIAPCYIFSYVVSNDAAMQIYQMERAESGAGLKMLTDNLAPTEITFMAFAEATQLESPFAEGRIQSVDETFRQVFEG